MTQVPGLGFVDDAWPVVPCRRVLERKRRGCQIDEPIVTAFRDGQVTLRNNRRVEGFTEADKSIGYQGVEPGDLVVHSMDGFAGAIGVSDSRGRMSPVVHIYRTPHCDERFVAYILRTVAASGLVTSLAKGIRERSTSFDPGTLADLTIPFPPLDVQRRIADFLDDQVGRLDALIALRQRQEALVAAKLVGTVEELTRGNGSQRVRLKSRLREVDQRAEREADPSELLSVSIHLGVVPRSEVTDDLPRADSLAQYKDVQVGDIVLNRMRAFQGGVGVARQKGVVSPDYGVLRPGEGCSPKYLHYLFRAPWFVGEMTSRLRGIGSVDQGNVRTPRVNIEDLLMTEVELPDLDGQLALAKELDGVSRRVRDTRDAIGRSTRLLEKRKRSLITAAVTGEFDVSSASSRAGGVVLSGVGGDL